MKKTVKILCLATAMFLVLSGVSFATPIAADYIFDYYNLSTPSNPLGNGVLGAKVYLDVTTTADGFNKYIYQIQNVAYDPLGNGPNVIHYFYLPITMPLEGLGWEAHPGDTHTKGTLEQLDLAVDQLKVSFSFELVSKDSNPPIPNYPEDPTFSNPFYIISKYALGDLTTAQIWNGGEIGDVLVFSNTGAIGGNNDTNPVPEPATLLLVGMGALGLEGVRRLRARRA
jgi:hypothetical protein